MKYLLPCQQCSEKTTIDMSQAGRQLTCRCGATLEVPSLRAIRTLETVADSDAKPPRRSWNLTRGLLFAAGLVLALAGLATAGLAGVNWVTATVPPAPVVNVGPALAELDTLSAVDTWDAWVDLRTNGLGPYMPTAKFMVETALERVFGIFVGGLVAVAVGLVIAAVAIVLPGQQAPRPRAQ
ncbi:MAG: hypothetical protein GX575_24500 [Candidatus Anammoximicrobium sp.]|nr:hypothetical protein [Candidatus Anammoximicrobium sp.]